MKYIWEERAHAEYYCDETGKVVATLSRISFSDDIWHAEVNGDKLGTYISFEHGKSAIEKKIDEIDREYELIRETMPKVGGFK